MRRSFPFVDYFFWHYTVAFKDILVIWFNLVWFTGHFFSLSALLRTFFSPWKRIHETHERAGLEDFFATIIVNIMARIVGAFIRLILIAVGFLVLIAECMGLFLWLTLWVALPFLAVWALLYGVMIMI